MLTVGITGGIASGKSLVTGLLAAQGAVTFSADQAARAVLVPGSPVSREIARIFGADAQQEDGSLNRERLAQRIFADEQARIALNRIMHPPILRLLRAQMDACRDDLPFGTVIVVEVPLLFETKMQTWFERIIVVTASEEIQAARLAARSGLTEWEARSRLSSQMPVEWKTRQADIVISNDGPVSATQQLAAELWAVLQRQAAMPASY